MSSRFRSDEGDFAKATIDTRRKRRQEAEVRSSEVEGVWTYYGVASERPPAPIERPGRRGAAPLARGPRASLDASFLDSLFPKAMDDVSILVALRECDTDVEARPQ